MTCHGPPTPSFSTPPDEPYPETHPKTHPNTHPKTHPKPQAHAAYTPPLSRTHPKAELFWAVVSGLSQEHLRRLVAFVTGSYSARIIHSSLCCSAAVLLQCCCSAALSAAASSVLAACGGSRCRHFPRFARRRCWGCNSELCRPVCLFPRFRPKVPEEGFKKLKPQFTLSRVGGSNLPSAHTCVNTVRRSAPPPAPSVPALSLLLRHCHHP